MSTQKKKRNFLVIAIISYATSVWADDQYSVTLDQTFILLMQDESRWLINSSLSGITAIPNFSNFMYVADLKSVNPGAVNITG